jgi:hypothetical protein
MMHIPSSISFLWACGYCGMATLAQRHIIGAVKPLDCSNWCSQVFVGPVQHGIIHDTVDLCASVVQLY